VNVAALGAAAVIGAGMVLAWQHTAKAEKEARKAADDYFSSLAVNTNSLSSINAGLASLRTHIDDVRHAAIKAGDVTRYGLVGDKTQSQVSQLTGHLTALSAKERQVAATETVLSRVFGLSRRAGGGTRRRPQHRPDEGAEVVGGRFRSGSRRREPLAIRWRRPATTSSSMGDTSKTAADAVKALKDALDLLAGKALSADEAAITFRNNIAALTKALHASHGSMSLNTQAGRDARQAFDSAAQSALDLAARIKDSTGSTDKARASLRRSIAALKDSAGNSDYAKAAIGRLQAAYNELGPAAVTATGQATRAVSRQAGAAKLPASSGRRAARCRSRRRYASRRWVRSTRRQRSSRTRL
jgi:hypothetical protein